MITRKSIVEQARLYLGTPFQHQGRLRGRACDCIGLPICVALDFGLNLPPKATQLNYDPYPADDTVLRNLKSFLREIPKNQIKPGDVLCLMVPEPCHVGIVVDMAPGLGIIHAYQPSNKVVEHTLDSHWFEKIVGAFLFPGVED